MRQFRFQAKICVNKMTNIHSNQAQLAGEFMCQKWRSYGISDILSRESLRIDILQLWVQDPIPLARTKQVRRFGLIDCYWFHSPWQYRPRVSISWALPQALASRGIPLPWAYGWHLLGLSESIRGVIPFPLLVLRDHRYRSLRRV